MQSMPGGPGIAGGLFFVVWLLMMLGMVVGYIFLLVAVWRGMKAHESIAETMRDIANNLKPKV